MAILKQKENKKEAFLPITQLEEVLKQTPDLPYQIEFSLKPYIEQLNKKMCDACDTTKSALLPILEGNQEYIESNKGNMGELIQHPHFKTLMSMAVPSLMYNSDVSFISPPFTRSFLVKTNTFEDFLKDSDWEVKMSQKDIVHKQNQLIIQAGICILNNHYNQNLPFFSEELMTVRNVRTKLIKHFRISFKKDFIDIEVKKGAPKLSQAQIDFLVQNPEDADLWLKTLSPEYFSFIGFGVGNLFDVTDIQVLSDFKEWLGYSSIDDPTKCIEDLGYYVRSFLGVDDLSVGILLLDEAMDQKDSSLSLTGEKSIETLLADNGDAKGIYDHMISAERVLYIEDLQKLENPSKAEKKLLDKNLRSFVMSPLQDENGQLTLFLEMGSTIPGTFNNWSVKKLQEIFNHINLSFEKFHNEINNQITAEIQKNFTSIHPSVSWKFEEVAKEYYIKKQNGQDEVFISPIIFEDVFPLYGQSDIVHSSATRNKLIKQDLLENIRLLLDLLESWSAKKKIHLLGAYQIKLEKLVLQLEEEFNSSDESHIVTMITKNIHPLLKTTVERYPELFDKNYKSYLSEIDSHLNIIYKKRKDFENSVNRLNAAVSEYLESEEEKMQALLPHFFEKYKTDGVEYNLYLGESLLKNGYFTQNDLSNFKLWQLESTCEITRLVDNLSKNLPVKLKTAELIFVYNHSLSIKFRMDEKKFDVDGAYNVRYEILKKRIDKATVKGSGERLTQSGKIAIVYLSESDKIEYLDFFQYLIAKDFIQDDIEFLELNDVQGAEGLNALRVTVKL